MHDAADETQSLCSIRSIVTDVILGRSGIFANPLFEVPGTGEDVRRMPLFRDLNDNGTLQLKNVFGANQEHLASSSPELVIEERIVVGLPGDLGDVEVGWDSQITTYACQFLALDRFTFKSVTDSLDCVKELAEAVVRFAGICQDLMRVSRETDLEAAGQGRFPGHQVPLAVTQAIFSALYECRLHAEFCADQVPPLIPRWVPRER